MRTIQLENLYPVYFWGKVLLLLALYQIISCQLISVGLPLLHWLLDMLLT